MKGGFGDRVQVQSFVKLQELFYAGSHGMDISGPQGDRRQSLEQLAFRPAARFEPIMQEVCYYFLNLPFDPRPLNCALGHLPYGLRPGVVQPPALLRLCRNCVSCLFCFAHCLLND